jgi:hypothetical protein
MRIVNCLGKNKVLGLHTKVVIQITLFVKIECWVSICKQWIVVSMWEAIDLSKRRKPKFFLGELLCEGRFIFRISFLYECCIQFNSKKVETYYELNNEIA